MSINSEPTMPGHLCAQRPTPVNAWAPFAAPPPWIATPPGWPQPMPPHAARLHRSRLPVGLAASVAVLAAAAVLTASLATHQSDSTAAGPTVTASSAPSVSVPPPPPPLVRDEVLPALLLDTATVNAVMGTSDLVVHPELTTDRLYIDTTDKPECGGVWANANKGAYTGSGWQAVQTRYLREADRPQHEVYESVISFPAAEPAKAFVANETQRWARCRNTALTTTNPELPPQIWFVATADQDGDVLTSVSNREGAGGYRCQHALTARYNVVVDTVACGRDVTGQGAAIAHRIAEQISRPL